MATDPSKQTKPASAKELMRAWERLNVIRNQLIKMGLADGNTSPDEVLRILRQQIPQDLIAA